MSTNLKTSFAIIAGVSIALDRIIIGAFNSHHKANLTKAGDTGQVTQVGAIYFQNRKRLTDSELKAEIEEKGYKLVDMPSGFQWAMNAQGATIQAGSGKAGQTLFVNALSKLTQAAKAKLDAEQKAAATKAARQAAMAKANEARKAQKAAQKKQTVTA